MSKTKRVRDGAVVKVPTEHGDSNIVPAGSIDLSKLAGDVIALLLPTGSRIGFTGTTAPTGWILGSGKTLGNSASGGTERAAEDTRNLYRLLWNSYTNTELPVSGGRGASADADFDAAKTITTPDYRGRIGIGKDDMGGALASRMTAAGSGIVGTTLGNAGGNQTHTLTTAQLASHGHGVSDPGHTHNAVGANSGGPFTFAPGGISGPPMPTYSTTTSATGISILTNGGGLAHNNTQPSIVETSIIKL